MGRAMMHHGSCRGQAIDELGMICASLAFLYVVLEVGHLESWRSTWGELRAGESWGLACQPPRLSHKAVPVTKK